MKYLLALCLILLGAPKSFAQLSSEDCPDKPRFYAFWGWNRDVFSSSDIHFQGENYNFKLVGVTAHDKFEKFGYDPYFHITKLTIPQTNVRIGYFITPKYSISLGDDHMKYVMTQNQAVLLSGHIGGTGTVYDGDFLNAPILTDTGFLKFEHTDGLNYINVELRRHAPIWGYHKSKWLSLDIETFSGFGAGVIIPKTNVRMFHGERNDAYHLAGYGGHLATGLGLRICKYFVLQPEFKGGFINLPDIRTSKNPIDRAQQKFWFGEFDVMFGGAFSIGKKKSALNFRKES